MKNYSTKNKLIFESLVCIITLFTPISMLQGQLFKELSLEDLVKSDYMVIAEVTSIGSYWNESRNRIFTEVKLKVKSNISGNLKEGDFFRINIIGGSIDGTTTIVLGSPKFALGEESVLFLSKRHIGKHDDSFSVVGANQGKFNVIKENEDKIKMLVRDQVQVPLRISKKGPIIQITADEAIPLQELINNIKFYTE